METEVFRIASAGSRPLLVLIPVAAILLIVGSIVAFSTLGSRRARFEISDTGLALRGDLYGRQIGWDRLDVAAARRVELAAEPGLGLRRRTMGTGLPGYRSGWFRLENGRSALVYHTDASRAVVVPTRDDYDLVLTPEDPEAFLEALREREEGAAGGL